MHVIHKDFLNFWHFLLILSYKRLSHEKSVYKDKNKQFIIGILFYELWDFRKSHADPQ